MLLQLEKPVDFLIPAKVASIDALTGLRFVAALLIFFSHTAPLLPGMPTPLYNLMITGFNGVGMFFILSGFVLYYNYQSNFKIRTFFVARFARIYPIYLLCFLLACLLKVEINPNPIAIIQQLTLTQVWNKDSSIALSFDAPAWSVGVEVFLYLCYPLLALKLLPRFKTLFSLSILIGFCALASLTLATYFMITGTQEYTTSDLAHYLSYSLPLTRLCDFIVGCAIAKIFLLKPDINIWLSRILFYGSIIFVVVFMAIDIPVLRVYHYAAAYILPFGLIILGLATQPTNFVSRFLASKPLVLLGEASYSFYLLHYLFIEESVVVLPQQWLRYPFLLGLILVVSLVSIICFKLVETPTRKLLRKLLESKPEPLIDASSQSYQR